MPTTIIFGILAIVFGYLCGSIPVGLWIGKLVIKADIRNYGSGTTGATNVIRTCGFKWGVLVFFIDILKSIIPTFLTVVASNNEIVPIWTPPLIGMSIMIGHNWPIFANFHGGKGVAVGLATLFIMSPFSGILAFSVAIPIMLLTKYVSVGSMIGSTVGGIGLFLQITMENFPVEIIQSRDFSYAIFAIGGTALTLYKHKDNIVRLLKGQEMKLGEPAKKIKSQEFND